MVRALPTTPRAPKVIKVGGDFVGLDAIGVDSSKYKVMFQSDNLPAAQKLMQQKTVKPEKIYGDVLERDLATTPETHFYSWTPPCQPFSSAGKRAGTEDARGNLLAVGIKYIVHKLPRVAIMENVKGLTHMRHKKVLKGMANALKSKYHLYWRVLNSENYQIAQSRERLFCVMIRKDCLKRPFTWPRAVAPRVQLEDVLDPVTPLDRPCVLPKNKRAKDRINIALKQVWETGINPRDVPVAIDIDCSAKYATFGVNIARTITHTRGGQGGPWVSTRSRRTTTRELMACQGFYPEDVDWETAGISKSQMGKMVGNSIPINMVGHIMANAMYSGGLLAHPVQFPASKFV